MTLTRKAVEKKWNSSPSWTRDEWISEVVFNQPVREVPWIGKYVKNEKTGNEYILPSYSTDISAAWEVEAVMRTDELLWKYTSNIKKIILMDKGFCNEYLMMHAAPDVRCKAALLAVLNL